MDLPGLQLRSPLWRYGFAVLAVGVAVGLTAGSVQLGLAEPPVAAFLAAILLTGWYAGLGAIDPEVEAVLLRVTQEAIANVVKHAAARTVRLTLGYETRRVRLSIVDDGQGFVVDPDFQSYGGHWGLLGMRERASQLHGTLSIQSTPGASTEIVLLVPTRAPGKRAAVGRK